MGQCGGELSGFGLIHAGQAFKSFRNAEKRGSLCSTLTLTSDKVRQVALAVLSAHDSAILRYQVG